MSSSGVTPGGGKPLATYAYAAATDTSSTTTSTTFVDVDATNQAVTFYAPSDGNVLVRVTGALGAQNSTNNVYFCLRNGSTNIGSQVVAIPVTTTLGGQALAFLVTGLTPNASVTLKLGYRTSNATTYATVLTGPNNGAVVYEVWAI